MTDFPMNTRLYRDGIDLSRFYANDLGELADSIYSMLTFSGDPIDDDLQYADVMTQLLGSFQGRMLILFGSIQTLRAALSNESWEQLNMGICKLFYLQKVGEWDAYSSCVHELDDLLKSRKLNERTANDQ